MSADEFSRIGRITMGIDCEDGANETLVFLWGVLTAHHSPGGKWNSRLMAAAQFIRVQYIVTLCLKSVTRPSQSGEDEETTRARRGLAAHASCDMVPLRAFARMLTSTTWRRDQPDAAAIAAIIEERKSSLLPDSVKLRVAVGETTGYVSSYVAAGSEAPRWARGQVRNIIAGVTRSARSIAQEDMSIDSTFYKYAVSALVHDTLISPGAQAVAKSAGVVWLVPQISYAEPASEKSASASGITTVWKKIFGDTKISADKLTYGAAHPKYFTCASDVHVLATRPVTRDIFDLVQRLSKFEHPIPSLLAPPPPAAFPNYAAVDAIFSKRFAELKFANVKLDERQRRRQLYTISICIPLHEMTEENAEAIAAATARCDALYSANYFIALVTEHVATLVIQFSFLSQ